MLAIPRKICQKAGRKQQVNLRIAAEEKQAIKVLRDVAGIKYVEAQGVKEPDTVDVWVEAEKDIDVRKPFLMH